MKLSARPIDHCVLPTADLDVARERLSTLGFTVAPNAQHPFGTENCCVYFADGAYLEPLAVADITKAQIAAIQGNVFVARDAAYRYRNGDDGFSGLVLGTRTADADYAHFCRAGISAGDLLAFSRPFIDAQGCKHVASFKLAFAADLRAPDAFFVAVERVNTPKVDRSALQSHENGVECIKEIILTASRPEAFTPFLQEVTGAKPIAEDGELRFAVANGDIVVRSPTAAVTRLDPGLLLTGIVFGVSNLKLVDDLLDARDIGHHSTGNHIAVPATAGQGAQFLFEEL